MTRYSSGAIVLHWLIALALAFQLALGFAMPDGASGFALIQLHKSLGIAILLLTALRLGWRLIHPRPQPLEQGVAHHLAHAVHIGFYLFMVLAPLTGWALVSTAPVKVPTILFGLVALPHLPLGPGLHEAAETAHGLLAWGGLALFALHIAGALRHEVLLRDHLLERMSPLGKRPIGVLLGISVLLVGAGSLLLIGSNTGHSAKDEPLAAAGPAAPAQAGAGKPEAAAEPEAAPTDQATEQASAEASEAAAAQDEPAPVPAWTIQPGGRLSFSVGSDEAGQIQGSFSRWSGSISFDPERPEKADIRISVDLTSASVGDSTQDAMLSEDEFFATGKFAKASFRASSARKTGANSYTANGTLDLKGAKRPQVISFRLTGSDLRRHVEGSATISRAAFAIGNGPSGESLDANVAVKFSFDAKGTVPSN